MVRIEVRCEFFVRRHRHRHPDPDAPTVLLLHGCTASGDLQFFTAYEALAEMCSFVAIDHQGHRRGLRSPGPFTFETVADDAMIVVRALGIERAIVVGYSMGGPLTLNLARRHLGFVRGMVVQATALEWRARLRERLGWKPLPLMGSAMRSWLYPRTSGGRPARCCPTLIRAPGSGRGSTPRRCAPIRSRSSRRAGYLVCSVPGPGPQGSASLRPA